LLKPNTPFAHQSVNPSIYHSSFDMAETFSNSPAAAAAPAVAATAMAPAARANRKERVGEVIASKMAKTIIVRVQRRFAHPKFKKVVTGYKKFYAHDEKNEAKVGDRVRIEETRPLSKTKRWRLVQVVERSAGITPVAV
jgi:small subunit ribosomal protein S17